MRGRARVEKLLPQKMARREGLRLPMATARSFVSLFVFTLVIFGGTAASIAADATWKAGTATVDITPTEPVWMAGYGGRDHPAEGKLHPIFVKVLALED